MTEPAANLRQLERALDSARLDHARMAGLYRVGRLHATEHELRAAEDKVSSLTAQVEQARAQFRESVAGEGDALLTDVQGALDAVAGVQLVLQRIAADLRAILVGAAGA